MSSFQKPDLPKDCEVIFDHPKRRMIGEHQANPLGIDRPISAFS